MWTFISPWRPQISTFKYQYIYSVYTHTHTHIPTDLQCVVTPPTPLTHFSIWPQPINHTMHSDCSLLLLTQHKKRQSARWCAPDKSYPYIRPSLFSFHRSFALFLWSVQLPLLYIIRFFLSHLISLNHPSLPVFLSQLTKIGQWH